MLGHSSIFNSFFVNNPSTCPNTVHTYVCMHSTYVVIGHRCYSIDLTFSKKESLLTFDPCRLVRPVRPEADLAPDRFLLVPEV
jgi:hypothetical protein